MPLKVMRHAYNSFLSLQSDIFRSVLCLEVFLPKFKDIQIMMIKNKNVKKSSHFRSWNQYVFAC